MQNLKEKILEISENIDEAHKNSTLINEYCKMKEEDENIQPLLPLTGILRLSLDKINYQLKKILSYIENHDYNEE